MTRLPDFFILGAPKCGTSALDQYLGEHPQIHMAPKETSFLADDFPAHHLISSWEQYMAQFARPKAGARIVGEGTFCYLYSQVAVRRIAELNPKARLIAMLRNPLDLVYSFHSQLSYNGEETEDFARALALQEVRRAGNQIPPHCQTAAMLQYYAVARLGEQVARVLEYFPRDQVKLILFDDFRRNTAEIYADTCRFVGVDSDGRREFPVVNSNKRHRSRWLGRFTEQPPAGLYAAARCVKHALGWQTFGVIDFIRRYNVQEVPRTPISRELRAEMAQNFLPDVELLSELVGRDLTDWLRPDLPRDAVERADVAPLDTPVGVA